MKVIKAFGNEHSYYTLPAYDGSHHGNVNAWLEAVRRIKLKDIELRKHVLQTIYQFSRNESNELDIISALLCKKLKYDIRVIWRRQECALHMYSLTSAETPQGRFHR